MTDDPSEEMKKFSDDKKSNKKKISDRIPQFAWTTTISR